MSKKAKKVNPYEKKKKRSLKITKQQWIAIICVLSAIVLVVGIALGNKFFGSDPHAGHNHGDLPEGHYEGDGHNHGTPASTAGHSHNTNTTDKVKYQLYTNADKTYRLVFRDTTGKMVAEFDKITKAPIHEAIDANKGIYELGWATGNGANEYECVYYNTKTGQVSQQFHAPRGTDGVRIAYGNKDQTKVIVQDLFNKEAYYKEHALNNATPDKNGDIIVGGNLKADKKTVIISYHSDSSEQNLHASINLYA